MTRVVFYRLCLGHGSRAISTSAARSCLLVATSPLWSRKSHDEFQSGKFGHRIAPCVVTDPDPDPHSIVAPRVWSRFYVQTFESGKSGHKVAPCVARHPHPDPKYIVAPEV